MPNVDYDKVTQGLMERMEAGVIPWACPWSKFKGMGFQNGHTRRGYNGLNVFLLAISGYSDPRWFTFNQVAKEYKGSYVRKGEKANPIAYFDWREREVTDAETGEKSVERYPLLKTIWVFNFEQIIWSADGKHPKPVETPPEATFDLDADISAFLKGTGASINHGGNDAFHVRESGRIQIPSIGQFPNAEAYYCTLFHELIHWTGAKERCNRDKNGRFGDPSYAFEELVAEIGSAFLCARFGVDNDGTQSAAYLQSWCKCLKEHKRALFSAAKLAREAVEFLTGGKETGETGDTEATN